MPNNRYPHINIRSKNELAKHLSHKKQPYDKSLALINDVQANFDSYWHDHPKQSQPEKGKWVRDASFTNLGTLLKMINKQVLAPHDRLLPNFIFGGVSKKSHKDAVLHLLGVKRGRVLLKLDIARFYEQITKDRVEQFFATKAGCGRDGAKLLAGLSCVALGAKGSSGNQYSLARGFSTSARLAVWCNLDIFIKIERLVRQELKGKDPRIAIYVDDIGITASRVSVEEVIELYKKLKPILESDERQPLPLNDSKTKIVFHSGETYNVQGEFEGKWCFEHLGVQMNRNSLTIGSKTRWKDVDLKEKMKLPKGRTVKAKRTKKAIQRYKAFISA